MNPFASLADLRGLQINDKKPTSASSKPDGKRGAEPGSSGKSAEGGPSSIRSVAGLLVIASLFALAGGSLDAYTFLTHNHVFSTAESGNVVLFGVIASGGEWAKAWPYLPPIGAFVLGTAVAKLLGAKTQKQTFRATLICQGLEGILLLFLDLFGAKLSSQLVVPLIAFCAALQSVSFAELGPWKFNNAMTTSNLRNGTSAIVSWLMGRDREKSRGQAIVSATIFLCFMAGALLGGLYTRRDARHALLPTFLLILIGFALTWRQRALYKRNRQEQH